MSDYKRFNYNGYYFEYTEYDLEPTVYWDEFNVPEDMMEMLETRKGYIKNLEVKYLTLRYEKNEIMSKSFENYHKNLIEIEHNIKKQYKKILKTLPEYSETPVKKGEKKYDEQNDNICRRCGKIIPYSEVKKLANYLAGLIGTGNEEEFDKHVGTCPYCKEAHLVGYNNIYWIRAIIYEDIVEKYANMGDRKNAIKACKEQIALCKKVDKFYKDVYSSAQREIAAANRIIEKMKGR